jgi:hypothetical protein
MAGCNCTGACRAYGTCSGLPPHLYARMVGCVALTDGLALLREDDPAYDRRSGERRIFPSTNSWREGRSWVPTRRVSNRRSE